MLAKAIKVRRVNRKCEGIELIPRNTVTSYEVDFSLNNSSNNEWVALWLAARYIRNSMDN